MGKTLRRRLSLVLALVLALSCMSVGAWAEDSDDPERSTTAGAMLNREEQETERPATPAENREAEEEPAASGTSSADEEEPPAAGDGDPVAMIGEAGYTTLAAAIAAVPSDGTETTVTMVADETIDVVGSAITIPSEKNIVLDLNGHQVVGTASTGKTSALIGNKGTLTIQDSSNGSGLLLTGATPTWVYDGGNDYSGSYASNTISNSGTLTIKSGTVQNISKGSAVYAVDNNSSGADAVLNVEGGTLKAVSVAVRMFANSYTKENTVNVSGGAIEAGYSGIWVQLPGSDSAKAMKAELTVSGGTLKGGNYAFYDYSFGNSFDATRYTLSGGTFDGGIFSYGANINITGGSYKSWIAIKQAAAPSNVSVSGGEFSDDVYTYDKYASEGFITGGLFAIDTYMDDGEAYSCDWLRLLAPGYAAATVTDGEYAGWYLVGPVSYASREIITTGKDTYLVKSYVKDGQDELDLASTSVAVEPIAEEAVADTRTTETVSLANVKTRNVAETAVAKVAADNVEGVTDINVTISLSKTNETANATLSEYGNAKEVFEVHPVATYKATYTDANNMTQTTDARTFEVKNEDLEGSFTFRLYLDSTKYSGLTDGSRVAVTHYKDGNTTESWVKTVQTDGNDNLYVTLTLSSFSHVAVKEAAAGANVNYTVKIADDTSGTAVIYPGDSVTMKVTVSGDDFYGGDFTVEYDSAAFDKGETSFASDVIPQNSRAGYQPSDGRLNFNLVKSGDRLADGSMIFSVAFTAKSTLSATATYDFKITDARVNFDNAQDADSVIAQYLTGDEVKVNAKKYTVTFDGVSRDWAYEVYEGKGVDTIPTDVQTGYGFKGWALTENATAALTENAIRNTAVTANVTYYPVFEAGQFNVTLSGATGNNTTASGQDYTATISDYDAANYDYTVTYKSGTNESKTITPTEAAFTIPAAEITGDLNITVSKTLKGFVVELHPDYVTGYTLVLVRAAAGNHTNPIYTYDNGAMFFVNAHNYTDENSNVQIHYNAYAILAEGSITLAAAQAKVGVTSTPATVLTIDPDVNATHLIDSSDLQAAFSGYKVQLTLPGQMALYLRADVNGDYKLDTTDVGLVNQSRTK